MSGEWLTALSINISVCVCCANELFHIRQSTFTNPDQGTKLYVGHPYLAAHVLRSSDQGPIVVPWRRLKTRGDFKLLPQGYGMIFLCHCVLQILLKVLMDS